VQVATNFPFEYATPLANFLEAEQSVVSTELLLRLPVAGVPHVTPKSPFVSINRAITTCGNVQEVTPVDVSAGPSNPAIARVVLVLAFPSPQLFSPSSSLPP